MWSRTFDAPFSTQPKLDSGGGIIFALENNEVLRVDSFGNTQKWTIQKKPAVLLPLDKQRIMALYSDGNMEIIGQADGWFVAENSGSSPQPLLPSGLLSAVSKGNNIAAAFSDGNIILLSIDERKILWKGESHMREIIKSGGRAEAEVEMLFDERGIYVLSKNGATGFTNDGRRLWFTLLQNAAAIPAFGEDGVLYSGGRDWILYAYKIEDRVLPDSINIYGPEPIGLYGTGGPQPDYIPNIPYFEYEIKPMLDKIDSAIKDGKVESNELAWTTFLMSVSTDELFIQYRLKALEMLGQIGSHETIPWLANIFRKETEPSVRSAAAAAIGAIGVDPQGIAIQTFLNSIIQGGGTAIKDDQILAAIVSATGALCRFSGPPLSETGIRILTLLSGKTQPVTITRQAKKELATLR
jgi:outer membrane protein assembly factor BamB